ncbi:hypothetical protein ACTFJW_07405 [Clostridium cagae]|uniref:hypothetical protein n=1 Tax=Clostridium cagae TaxID=2080751 RepID=UPI003F76183B
MNRKELFEIDKYINLSQLSEEEAKKRVVEAPDVFPITGLLKIESYYFDEGVVYGTQYPYDAYTLPTYNENDKCFYRVKIDMDDDFRGEYELVCELEELEDREDFEEIKKFYGIGVLDKLIDEIMQS